MTRVWGGGLVREGGKKISNLQGFHHLDDIGHILCFFLSFFLVSLKDFFVCILISFLFILALKRLVLLLLLLLSRSKKEKWGEKTTRPTGPDSETLNGSRRAWWGLGGG
jgi:hypothetical protein